MSAGHTGAGRKTGGRLRLVSVGDSFSCGEGVGLRVDLPQTWVGLLATGLGARWTPLAVAGARVGDVRAGQLPAALAARADVATVLVGLNDVVRAGFDAAAVAHDLRTVVLALRDGGALVLLARLHDPVRLLPSAGPLTAPLRRAVHRRVQVVNEAVDALACEPGVHVVDLAAVTPLAERSGWATDRLHPSPTGHRAIATTAAAVLRTAGLAVDVPCGVAGPSPSAVAQVRWLLAHGLPWGAAHVRSVGLPLLAATLPTGRSGDRSLEPAA